MENENLQLENKVLTEKLERLMQEVEATNKIVEELEHEKPYVLIDSLVGPVVPLIEYNKLQLASAKARTFLQVKVNTYKERLKFQALGVA